MTLRANRPSILLLPALALLIATAAQAQVLEDPGDGRTGGLAPNEDALAPLEPMAKVSDSAPEPDAIAAYNRGLGYRDKALELERQAAAAAGPKAAKKAAKAQRFHLESIEHFRSAVEQAPDFYQALGTLAYALLETGQYQEALVAYDRALSVGPTYPEAIAERGKALLGLDRVEAAKGAYTELLRVDRKSAADLLQAMKRWLEERTKDPGELSAETLEDFADWLEKRTADPDHGSS